MNQLNKVYKLIKDTVNEIGPGLFFIFLLEIVFFSLTSEYFLSWANFKNIFRASTIIGVMALGQTIVIISGGFDLSVGAVSAATGMAAAWLLQEDYGFFVAVIGAILIGSIIGVANGAITGYARINPLITTLGMMSIVRGLGFVVSGGYDIAISNRTFLKMGSGQILSIPYLAIILVFLFLVIGLSIPRFSFGRYMYAIGSNERACVLAGVRVNRWKLLFYGTCGALAGLAGVITSARVGVGAPQINMGVELGVITAVILGGTALTGGKGRILGTFLGLFIVSTMSNGLVMLSVPTFYKYVATGSLLLSAVIYDEWRRSQYAKR